MGKWVHCLSEIDIVGKRAVCAGCGQVDIFLRDKGGGKTIWSCRESARARAREHRKTPKHKSYMRAYQRERMKDEEQRRLANLRSRKWARGHKEHLAAWKRNHLKNNPQARLTARLRTRLHEAVRNNLGLRFGSAVRDLGCTVAELKIWLEKKFYPNSETGEVMTWENYGSWHIDHVVALAKFDLTDRAQFLQACHYSNLQPMWARDNERKGAR